MDTIKASWAKAEPLGVETIGVILFKHIFAAAPGALQLFPFKDVENLYESEDLKFHASKVVKTVGKAVGNIENLEPLFPTLKTYGKNHVEKGVTADMYPVVGQALLDTLKDGLGDDFTQEVKSAWTTLFTIISETMVAGSKEAEKKKE